MDALFNLFKIKFDKLDELLNEGNNITQESTINIYFNLECIWRLMINPNTEKLLRNKNESRILDVTSNIINIAAHYRLWCKKHKLQSRVILFTPSFDKIKYKNTMFNFKFRYNSLMKYNDDTNQYICQETIKEAIRMAKTISEYIDGVYLIESFELEPSIIPALCLNKFGKDDINFIITTDPYDFQYTNYGFYMFRPKKDDSFLIRQGNLIKTVKELEGVKNDTIVSDELYTFILSILGDINRNIDKIKRLGFSSILTLIDKAIDHNMISDNTRSIEMLVKSLKDEHRNDVLNNFYCTDIDFQVSTLPTSSILRIEYQIKDRFDMDSLIKLNNTYFNEFPLQLFELSAATEKPQTKQIPRRRNPF